MRLPQANQVGSSAMRRKVQTGTHVHQDRRISSRGTTENDRDIGDNEGTRDPPRTAIRQGLPHPSSQSTPGIARPAVSTPTSTPTRRSQNHELASQDRERRGCRESRSELQANNVDKRVRGRTQRTTPSTSIQRSRGTVRGLGTGASGDQRGRAVHLEAGAGTDTRRQGCTANQPSASSKVVSRVASARGPCTKESSGVRDAAASSHFSPAKTAPSAAGGSGGSEDVPSPAPLTAAPRLEGTGPSVLSVADRVVTEYEKLLEAMPVLSCHMGKLQLDTEAMAEGLERRVQDLVDGYRELNNLAEQAPLYVMQTASDYARALGATQFPEPRTVAADGGESQGLNVEEIHRELFALREAKLALDKAVSLPQFDEGGEGTARPSGKRGVDTSRSRPTGISRWGGLSSSTAAATHASGRTVTERQGIKSAIRNRQLGAMRGVYQPGVPGQRSRRVLAEVQVDPDLPLPLPTFPGYSKLLSPPEERAVNSLLPCVEPTGSAGDGDRKTSAGASAGRGAGGRGIGRTRHGPHARSAVPPRQRQSHSLPQELRAIATVPNPERWAGLKSRRRPRHTVPADSSMRRKIPPPLPPTHTVYKAKSRLASPAPGSVEAVAAARGQRKETVRAVEELRKEFREREGRLMQELNKIKGERSEQRPATVGPPQSPPAASKRKPPGSIWRSKTASVYRAPLGLTAGRPSRAKAGPVQAAVPKPGSAHGPVEEGGTRDRNKQDVDNDGTQIHPIAVVRTVDAEAQTAADGVHLCLPPDPGLRNALQDDEHVCGIEEKSVQGNSPRVDDRTSVAQAATCTGLNRVAEQPALLFSPSSSTSGGLGKALDSRGVIPPPPTVFIEGEGRNTSWRPYDDNRLLQARGVGGPMGASSNLSGPQPAKTIVAADAGQVRDKEDHSSAEKADIAGDGNVSSPSPERARSQALPDKLATERMDDFPYPSMEDDDDRWVEVGGMLGLPAMTSVNPTAATTSADVEEEVKVPGEAVAAPAPARAAVSPELLDLMREVVGQQRSLGEERSALMQTLRAEVEARRSLLENHELSLRQRELALARRESGQHHHAGTLLAEVREDQQPYVHRYHPPSKLDAEPGTAEAFEEAVRDRGAPAQQGCAAWTGGVGVKLPVQKGSSDAGGISEHRDSGDDNRLDEVESLVAPVSPGREGKEGEQGRTVTADAKGLPNPATHAFRSNLGRILAGGSSWRMLPMRQSSAPRRTYSTSLGRMLAAGPAWQDFPLGDEEQEAASRIGTVDGYGGSAKQSIDDGFAQSDDNVQELLWEAQQGVGREGDDRRRSSPAPWALEARRFAEAKAEADRSKDSPNGEIVWETPLSPRSSGSGVAGIRLPAERPTVAARVPALAPPQARRELRSNSRIRLSRDQTEDAGVEAAEAKREGTREIEPRPLLANAFSSSSARGQDVRAYCGGRLELVLSTAILSITQRVTDMERGASARVREVETAAREALEEAQRQARANGERQSEVISRLEYMERGSQERAEEVAKEVAKLREEARLARERVVLAQPRAATSECRTPRVGTPSWMGSSTSSDDTTMRGGDVGVTVRGAPVPDLLGFENLTAARPPLPSASRSSMSEGQLRSGSFSDGELVRLTPGGRHVLEEGEIIPSQGNNARPPARHETTSPAAGVFAKDLYQRQRGDSRPRFSQLVSAYPRLQGNGSLTRRGVESHVDGLPRGPFPGTDPQNLDRRHNRAAGTNVDHLVFPGQRETDGLLRSVASSGGTEGSSQGSGLGSRGVISLATNSSFSSYEPGQAKHSDVGMRFRGTSRRRCHSLAEPGSCSSDSSSSLGVQGLLDRGGNRTGSHSLVAVNALGASSPSPGRGYRYGDRWHQEEVKRAVTEAERNLHADLAEDLESCFGGDEPGAYGSPRGVGASRDHEVDGSWEAGEFVGVSIRSVASGSGAEQEGIRSSAELLEPGEVAK